MATAHLCSKDTKSGTGAARYPLIANGSDLLIIVKKTAWTNKELIAVPVDERYLMAATVGICSTYNVRPTSSYPDGDTMVNRLKNMRSATTVNQWVTGHKPMYNYCARGFCPWAIRYDSNVTSHTPEQLEFGTSWQALKFNLYAMPIGNASSFKAYWRIWNPSTLHICTVDIPFGAVKNYYGYTYLYNKPSHLCYHFDDALSPAKQCIADGHGEIDIPSISNEGKGNGASVGHIDVDPYGAHLKTASASSAYSRQHTAVYKRSSDKNQYYKDVEITGDQLAALKAAIAKGVFWVHCGYSLGNLVAAAGWGQTMHAYSTMFTQFTRLELRLVVSMPKINS